jgi:hypothetical protein
VSSEAHCWLMVLGTIQPRGRMTPEKILHQAAKIAPTIRNREFAEWEPVGVNGRFWRFADGSTLIVNRDGIVATQARTGEASLWAKRR